MRVGIIDFSNSFPIFYALQHRIIPNDIEFSCGTPAQINAQLRTGTLDIALISSEEFLKNRSSYLILSDLGIGASAKVISVRLFFNGPLSLLNHQRISIPGWSATSVRLLRCLCKYFWKVAPTFEIYTHEAFAKLPTTVGEAPATKRKRISTKPIAPAMGEERCSFSSSRREQNVVASFAKASHLPRDCTGLSPPFLLIGDPCLQYDGPVPSLDLAQAWHEATGQGSIFALIATRKEAFDLHPNEVARVHQLLNDSYQWGLAHFDVIVNQGVQRTKCDAALMKTYYSTIEYQLKEHHFKWLDYFSSLEI